MNPPAIRIFMLIFLSIGSAIFAANMARTVSAAPGFDFPKVGVWSSACRSANVTVSNGLCGALSPGNQFIVQLNVSYAPDFNSFELALFYDPGILSAVKTNVNASDTVFGANAFVFKNSISSPGLVQLSVSGLGAAGVFHLGFGILARVTFNVIRTGVSSLTLAAGMSQPAGSSAGPEGQKPYWTRLVNTVASGQFGLTYPIGVSTIDGYFMNEISTRGPQAKFTFTPLSPSAGQEVKFNATNSFDPDNLGLQTIKTYSWDFGDQSEANVSTALINHIFGPTVGGGFSGNFSVRLTVTDRDDNLSGMSTQRVELIPPPKHDMALWSIDASPKSVSGGGPVTVAITVKNLGTFRETYNLTIAYGPPTRSLPDVTNDNLAPGVTKLYTNTIDTAQLSSGSYEVVATVIDPKDNDTSNNRQTAIFTVQVSQVSPFLYIVGGVIGAGAATGVVWFFLKRRRRGKETL